MNPYVRRDYHYDLAEKCFSVIKAKLRYLNAPMQNIVNLLKEKVLNLLPNVQYQPYILYLKDNDPRFSIDNNPTSDLSVAIQRLIERVEAVEGRNLLQADILITHGAI